jgi:hypothetical protein
MIMSSWIGGPHGWIDWEGNIGCNLYNIGKWPAMIDVEWEWNSIAKAFPFLKLRAQLFSGEISEEGITPLVEYVVADGAVRCMEPTACLPLPTQEEIDQHLSANVGALFARKKGRERGCTLETFAQAFQYVIDKYNRSK